MIKFQVITKAIFYVKTFYPETVDVQVVQFLSVLFQEFHSAT